MNEQPTARPTVDVLPSSSPRVPQQRKPEKAPALERTAPLKKSPTRNPKRFVALGAAVLVALGAGAYLLSSGSSDDVSAPIPVRPPALLSAAGVAGLLTTPAGMAAAKPAAGDLRTLFCSELLTLTSTPAAGSVSRYALGAGTSSAQSLRVFPTAAAATAFVTAATAGAPCTSPSGSFAARPRAGSYAFVGVLAGRRLNEVLDLVAVRNVVYLSADGAFGKPADAAGHDARTAAVRAALAKR